MTKEKVFAINVYESDTQELHDAVVEVNEAGLEQDEFRREIYSIYNHVRKALKTDNVVNVLPLTDNVTTHIVEFPVITDGTFYEMHLSEEENNFYLYLEQEVEEEGAVEV